MVLTLRRRFRLLALFSAVGHRREDLTVDPGVRFWVVQPYLVVFAPETSPLFIARILHGSRDPDDLRAELRRPEE